MVNNLKPFFANKLYSVFDEFFNDNAFGDNVKLGGNYDIEKLDDNFYRIHVNVAGLKKEEIELLLEKDVLTVKGKTKKHKSSNYLHKGINFEFSNSFTLPDGAEIKGAYLENGILEIDIKANRKLENGSVRIPIK